MKALVTGGSGFLGSEIVRQLLHAGSDVRILIRKTSTLELMVDTAGAVETFFGDIRDPDAIGNAMSGVDMVYHTAACIGFGHSKKKRLWMHDVNIRGTATVVDAARNAGVQRLVHTSSVAALGRTAGYTGLIDETQQWQPSKYNSAYAESKYFSELEVHRAIAEGLDAVIVNPSLIFGNGKPSENTWQLVEKVARGRIPAIPAGGSNVVDVKDVAAAHLLAMDKGETGERYFLGSENLSWETIFTTLANALNVDPPGRHISARSAMFLATLLEVVGTVTGSKPLINRESARMSGKTYRYDHAKAVKKLGCEFRPFTETARELAALWKSRSDT